MVIQNAKKMAGEVGIGRKRRKGRWRKFTKDKVILCTRHVPFKVYFNIN